MRNPHWISNPPLEVQNGRICGLIKKTNVYPKDTSLSVGIRDVGQDKRPLTQTKLLKVDNFSVILPIVILFNIIILIYFRFIFIDTNVDNRVFLN